MSHLRTKTTPELLDQWAEMVRPLAAQGLTTREVSRETGIPHGRIVTVKARFDITFAPFPKINKRQPPPSRKIVSENAK